MKLKEAWAKYANYCKECELNRKEPLSFGDWVYSELVDLIEEDGYYLFEDCPITKEQLDEISSVNISDEDAYFSEKIEYYSRINNQEKDSYADLDI